MRFTLVDRIVQIQPGSKITTLKNLSLAEEYLADHFPRFPVMPGVLMLEAMTQAGAMLVRVTEDFAHSVVVLKEARNVKYADFVQPGQTLTITADILKHDERETQLKAQGTVGGKIAVSGRLVLERYNLSENRPEMAMTDGLIVRQMRELLNNLYSPSRDDGDPLEGMEHTERASTNGNGALRSAPAANARS
jgi:3-hydroxyacyl-[acyl-carrier-protein] dehydratase